MITDYIKTEDLHNLDNPVTDIKQKLATVKKDGQQIIKLTVKFQVENQGGGMLKIITVATDHLKLQDAEYEGNVPAVKPVLNTLSNRIQPEHIWAEYLTQETNLHKTMKLDQLGSYTIVDQEHLEGDLPNQCQHCNNQFQTGDKAYFIIKGDIEDITGREWMCRKCSKKHVTAQKL